MAANQETERQEIPKTGMYRELLYIHSHLRRDLQTVRRLANEARAGLPLGDIVEEIRNLETSSPLWQLKFGCMHYCRFVHGHHTLEDLAMFPLVRRHDPSLSGVVDRLMEDHRAVHQITERIVALSEQLQADESGESLSQLIESLTELEGHLLAHLDLEEQSLGPLLSTWQHWPNVHP